MKQKMMKWSDTRGEQEAEYSPSMTAHLMDLNIEFETFEIEIQEEVVLSDKHDRQVCISRPGTKSYDELIAKGWYVIEGLSPDELLWDCEPQL